MRNLLVEISAIDPDSTLPFIIRACSAGEGTQSTLIDGKEWKPVLTSGLEQSFSYWGDGQPQSMNVDYGSITFLLSAAPGIETNRWTKYHYDGALASIWSGEVGTPFSAYDKVWSGACGSMTIENGMSARIPLLGPEAALVRDLLDISYVGTGGADGTSQLMGTHKPWSVGFCTNITPVLIDPARQVYQVNGYTATTTQAVYENALTLGAPHATVNDYNELIALTLPNGKWAVAPGMGMFRLANEPSGKLTADIGGIVTVGQAARTLMLKAGLSASRIGSSISGVSRSMDGIYAVDQESILDRLHELAYSASSSLLCDGEGVFHFVPWISTKAVGALNDDRSSFPLVKSDTIAREATASPAYKIRVGHTHVWSPHSSSEISPAFAEIAGDQAASEQKLKELQELAAEALAEAKINTDNYRAMSADNVLDRPEKQRLIQDVEGYKAERTGIVTQATQQGIVGKLIDYKNAYDALIAYLDGLNPDWDDTSADTTIDRNAFLAVTTGYLNARSDLLTARVEKSGGTSTWDGVTGPNKPKDNADVTADNISKDTAAVNGTPAKDVMDKVAKVAVIEQDIVDLKTTYGDTAAAKAYSEAAQQAAANAEASKQSASDFSGTASTYASNAQGQAQIATDKAAASANSATQSSTFRDQASGFATNASNSATAASTDAARASSSAVLSAQISAGGVNSNAAFNVPGYEGSVPSGWLNWNAGTTLLKSNQVGRNGTIPIKMNSGGNQELGIYQYLANIPAGWYVIEAEVQKTSGNWQGSGVHCNFNNGTSINIGFGAYADIEGRVSNGSTPDRRAWSVLVFNPTIADANFYAMGGWSGFTFGGSSNVTHWHKCLIRQATDGEIKAQKAYSADPTAPISASVKTVSDAVTTLNGSFAQYKIDVASSIGDASTNASLALSTANTAKDRTGAYFKVQTDAPGGTAYVTVASDQNAAGVEIGGNTTFRGNLNVGADSGPRMKITNSSIIIYDGNNVTRVKLGLF